MEPREPTEAPRARPPTSATPATKAPQPIAPGPVTMAVAKATPAMPTPAPRPEATQTTETALALVPQAVPKASKPTPAAAVPTVTVSTKASGAKATTRPVPDDEGSEEDPARKRENELEDKIRAWLEKMDQAEIKKRINKVKEHPLFPEYEQYLRENVYDIEDHEPLPTGFGDEDEDEELVSFLLWEAMRKDAIPATALPDPNPTETAAVAVMSKAPASAMAPANTTTASAPAVRPEPRGVTFGDEVNVTPANAAAEAVPRKSALKTRTEPSTPPTAVSAAPMANQILVGGTAPVS